MQAFVIGGREMVTGFQLVGVRGIVASSIDEALRSLLKTVENMDVGLILISEEFSREMRNKIDELRLNRAVPLIVEIPGKLGPSKAIDISDVVRRAIGIKV